MARVPDEAPRRSAVLRPRRLGVLQILAVVVRQTLAVRQILGARLDLPLGLPGLRPSASVSDAWGVVHLGIGLVLKCRLGSVAGNCRERPMDGDQKLACRAVCLRLVQDFRFQVRGAATREPYKQAADRSAASPCGAREAPEPRASS